METIKSQVLAITQSVLDGETSACEAYDLLKELKRLIEIGLDVVRPQAVNESKHGRVHKNDNENVTISNAF